ncbi:MAG: hypothetical protein HYT63_02245 [Candidatus Yanofskybacteria bacterium]|nr:hypothetical protein [Candidatus Yanofskybacteria bacterium]
MEAGSNRENKKSFWRRWTGVLVLAVVAILIIWSLLNLSEIFNAVQGKLEAWKYERLVKKMEAPYKNDKYGGKTPEETFDLFLEALRKEDIELASKYFVIKKQDEWKKTLGKYRDSNLLASLTNEFQINRKDWQLEENDGNVARFKYFFILESEEEELPLGNGKTQKITRPAGRYSSDVIFEKYLSGVWKISKL